MKYKMEDRLRKHVDGLFAGTAPTKKAVELKEEMIMNLQDKYNDLLSDGKTPEAAYNIAVAGIGDVSGLLKELETEQTVPPSMAELENARRRSGLFTALAVMLYILSVLPITILYQFNSRIADRLGVPLLFVFIAAATGILVYNNITKPRFRKGSDTVVEEFREWQTDTRYRRSLRRSVSAALWSLLLALYFIASFVTNAWHVTWILFIFGAAIEAIINIFSSLKK
jgi:hypothetical protein